MEIKKLTAEDLQNIIEISNEQFNDGWTSSQISEALIMPNYICIGLEQQNKIVSYCLALDSLDDINILSIATKQEKKQKGYASFLVEYLSQLAQKENKTLSLEVKEHNNIAISFYEKMGFKKIHTRKNYYKDGSDACIMFKFLP